MPTSVILLFLNKKTPILHESEFPLLIKKAFEYYFAVYSVKLKKRFIFVLSI